MKRGSRVLVVAVAAAVTALGLGPLAVAQPIVQTSGVSALPATTTPNVNNGAVLAITQVGSRIILGGTFTSASQQGSTAVLARNRILAFDATTGVIDPTFAPNLNGTVQTLTPGPSADTVYAGGSFTTMNGVAAKSLVLLSTVTGKPVAGFTTPALNGVVYSATLSANRARLFLGGSFTKVGTTTHQGLATLVPTTGALDPYLNVQLTVHHNYTGAAGQANGPLGPRKLSISPDGRALVAVGNFKRADGLVRDQIVKISLTGTTPVVDPTWATSAFSAACAWSTYDTYMDDVDFSPDSSYFVVATTGGGGTNIDGTNSTCDAVSRFETTITGSNIRPTWIDYAGRDTIGSVAVAGDAVYVGGHERWLNNENGVNTAGQAAVPRPGLAALDPVNGVPFSWNPGREPRGVGAFALLVTSTGVYVGSDTEYIGAHRYVRKRIAFFPLAGGATPPPSTTASLPTNVYLAGQLSDPSGGSLDTLRYRQFSGTTAGATSTVTTGGIAWSQVRGAFLVGSTLFYGKSDGTFNERSFDGSTLGPEQSIDPYDDPAWDSVPTGSGQTYQGAKPDLYGQLANVTGMFFSGGMLYYTLAGQSALYARYFTPESGIMGPHVFTYTGADLSAISGMFFSGGQIYYAAASTGALHRVSFTGAALVPTSDTVVSGPSVDGNDWRAHGMFLDDNAPAPNTPPTASIVSSCQQLTCTFDGSGSTDADGTVTGWAWTFGDGSTASGSTVTHTYEASGTYSVTLTVTDDDAATGQASADVSPVAAADSTISFVGTSSTAGNGTGQTVTVPAGVKSGDGLLLVSSTATVTAPAGPVGWALMKSVTNSSMTTTVWQRVAGSADAGTAVPLSYGDVHQAALQLLAYRGTSASLPVSQAVVAADTATTATHTTPPVSSIPRGSWAVSYWADKSSSTTAWTAPAGVSTRAASYGTGSGRMTALVVDAGPVSGSYGGLTASTDVAGAKAEQWTLVLAPLATS